jgi:hypothetical protein
MRALRLLGSLALAASVSTLAGCAPRPDDAACREMLDHYVEMSARADPALGGMSAIAADDHVREVLISKRWEPVYTRAVKRCLSETSGAAHACAMKAPTPNEWEACVQ